MKKILYKKILVTHDGSKLASAALPHALTLAVACNARILLFRVVETTVQEISVYNPMVMAPPVPAITQNSLEIVELDKKKAREQLNRLKVELENKGARVDTKVAVGNAGSEIAAAAKEENSDLIVMSTRGRSGLGRALLGSVADYVIRHASCPVFIVRPIPWS